MAKQGSGSRKNRPIRVLYLYQYDHAVYPSGLPIHAEFERERQLLRSVGGREIQVHSLREACRDESNPMASIFERFKRVVTSGEYPLAFAILTEDKRPASSAGNLFFEVGFWQAYRGESTICIVQHGKIRLPSDLQTLIRKRVRDAIGAQRELESLVERWMKWTKATRDSTDSKPVRGKIKEVFRGTDRWEEHHFTECRTHHTWPDCDVRLFAPGLTAVLKNEGDRMSRIAELLDATYSIYNATRSLPSDDISTGGWEFMFTALNTPATKFARVSERLPPGVLSLNKEETDCLNTFRRHVAGLIANLAKRVSQARKNRLSSQTLKKAIVDCILGINLNGCTLINTLQAKAAGDWAQVQSKFGDGDGDSVIEPHKLGESLQRRYERLTRPR